MNAIVYTFKNKNNLSLLLRKLKPEYVDSKLWIFKGKSDVVSEQSESLKRTKISWVRTRYYFRFSNVVELSIRCMSIDECVLELCLLGRTEEAITNLNLKYQLVSLARRPTSQPASIHVLYMYAQLYLMFHYIQTIYIAKAFLFSAG